MYPFPMWFQIVALVIFAVAIGYAYWPKKADRNFR